MCTFSIREGTDFSLLAIKFAPINLLFPSCQSHPPIAHLYHPIPLHKWGLMVAIHPASLHANIQLIVYEAKPWGTHRNWDASPYITEKNWRKGKIKSSYTEDECQWPHWSLDLSLLHLHPVLFPFAFPQEMCICLHIYGLYININYLLWVDREVMMMLSCHCRPSKAGET